MAFLVSCRIKAVQKEKRRDEDGINSLPVLSLPLLYHNFFRRISMDEMSKGVEKKIESVSKNCKRMESFPKCAELVEA